MRKHIAVALILIAIPVLIFLLSGMTAFAQGTNYGGSISIDWKQLLIDILTNPMSYGIIILVIGVVIASGGKAIGIILIIFGLMLTIAGYEPARTYVVTLLKSLI